MRWRKLGAAYHPDGSKWWARTHAMIPTPVVLNDDVVRTFITCCDDQGIGRVGYVDVDAREPTRVVGSCDEPLFDIGQPGTFDEDGTLACSVVTLPTGEQCLYYAGFELGTKIRYRLLTGMARRAAGEASFRRIQQTPVLERSDKEPFFRGGPFVLHEGGRFRMWYAAGGQWERVGDVMKPVYEIRYIESADGIHWPDGGKNCIRIERDDEHGFGRPYVVRDGTMYRMFYSIRRRDLRSYRLGYAESDDGIHWQRKDEEIGLNVSASGWDSEMICYAAVIRLHGTWYMFYNGNDFGRSGFGVAELLAW